MYESNIFLQRWSDNTLLQHAVYGDTCAHVHNTRVLLRAPGRGFPPLCSSLKELVGESFTAVVQFVEMFLFG